MNILINGTLGFIYTDDKETRLAIHLNGKWHVLFDNIRLQHTYPEQRATLITRVHALQYDENIMVFYWKFGKECKVFIKTDGHYPREEEGVVVSKQLIDGLSYQGLLQEWT